MQVLVLGSAAGGGSPCPDCRCGRCGGPRPGRPRAGARLQTSLALSVDGERWVLLNASPDLAQQILLQPALQPRPRPAPDPIAALVLTDARLDHAAGVLSLRDGPPVELYATASVFEDLTVGLPLLPALQHYCGLHWHPLPVGGERRAAGFVIEGFPALRFEAFALAGAPPPYSARRSGPAPGDSIALRVVDAASGGCLFVVSGPADADAVEAGLADDADVVLVNAGCGGCGGAVALLSRLGAARRVLTHLAGDDPLLDAHGAARAGLARRGIEVASDGMRLLL